MDAVGLDRQVMMGWLGRYVIFATRRRSRNKFGRRSNDPRLARLSQCILRPASMAGGRRRERDLFRILLTELARRNTKSSAESATEMRGVTKTVTICNFGDRVMDFQGVPETRPRALQPALAEIMAEIIAYAFEQFLKIALRNTFVLCDARRRQFGVSKLALDHLADAIHGRGSG